MNTNAISKWTPVILFKEYKWNWVKTVYEWIIDNVAKNWEIKVVSCLSKTPLKFRRSQKVWEENQYNSIMSPIPISCFINTSWEYTPKEWDNVLFQRYVQPITVDTPVSIAIWTDKYVWKVLSVSKNGNMVVAAYDSSLDEKMTFKKSNTDNPYLYVWVWKYKVYRLYNNINGNYPPYIDPSF